MLSHISGVLLKLLLSLTLKRASYTRDNVRDTGLRHRCAVIDTLGKSLHHVVTDFREDAGW